jgi:hypothetical protein
VAAISQHSARNTRKHEENTFYAVNDLLERFRDRSGVAIGHAENFDTVGSSTLGFCALQPSCEL